MLMIRNYFHNTKAGTKGKQDGTIIFPGTPILLLQKYTEYPETAKTGQEGRIHSLRPERRKNIPAIVISHHDILPSRGNSISCNCQVITPKPPWNGRRVIHATEPLRNTSGYGTREWLYFPTGAFPTIRK